MVLVPRVVDSVAPTPIVAAGGIADGRGLAAVLALGGDAAVLGTRLLATTESNAHELYKKMILVASEAETVHTSLFGNGWPNAPHRMLRTPSVEKWLEDEKRGSEQRPEEPLIGEVTFGGMRTPLPRLGGIPPARDATGEIPQKRGTGWEAELLLPGPFRMHWMAQCSVALNHRMMKTVRIHIRDRTGFEEQSVVDRGI